MTAPERTDPPLTGDERTLLESFLDFHRDTVLWKCSGLTDEQARKQLVASELTTVAGLLAHLRLVEEYWFCVVLDRRPDPMPEALKADPDAEFRIGMRTPLPELLADYRRQCETSRLIQARMDLDVEVPFRDLGTVSVRWVLIHMIEETARHNGHLDLLREQADGATGE